MHVRSSPLFVLLLVVALLGAGLAATNPVSAAQSEPDPFAAQVVKLLNAERAAVELAPLRWQANLASSAAWMAADMAARDYVGHTDRLGRRTFSRLPSFGYENYDALGENVAAGYATPEAVVDAWMSRPQHRANVLSPNHSELGVGYSFNEAGAYQHYWVLDFGNRYEGE